MNSVRHIPPRLESIPPQPQTMMCCFPFQEKQPLQGAMGLLDWRLLGKLSSLQISNFFSGNTGETMLVLPGHRLPLDYLVLIGAGRRTDICAEKTHELLTKMGETASQLRCPNIVLTLPGRPETLVSEEDAVQWFCQFYRSGHEASTKICYTIMDTLEMQSVLLTELERLRMQEAVSPTSSSYQLI